jgi:DNA-binding HxlR family transcriptional regulator
MGWKTRTSQTELILRYVNKFGPLEIDELQSLTGISEHDLTSKIDRLNEIGEIEYNETNGMIREGSTSGPNKQLDDNYN